MGKPANPYRISDGASYIDSQEARRMNIRADYWDGLSDEDKRNHVYNKNLVPPNLDAATLELFQDPQHQSEESHLLNFQPHPLRFLRLRNQEHLYPPYLDPDNAPPQNIDPNPAKTRIPLSITFQNQLKTAKNKQGKVASLLGNTSMPFGPPPPTPPPKEHLPRLEWYK